MSLPRDSRLAAEVYKDMPETSFTRTISNPEVVMKRRRQQKLEKRMQEFRGSDGRPDSGRLHTCPRVGDVSYDSTTVRQHAAAADKRLQ